MSSMGLPSSNGSWLPYIISSKVGLILLWELVLFALLLSFVVLLTTAVYHQVLTHPAAGSERDQLTVQEQAQLTQKLDESFNLISTDNLESC